MKLSMVHYSKPRKTTIHKYELLLKSLLIRINKEGKTFQVAKFCADNKVGKHFTTVCQNLGYIIRSGNRNNSIYNAVLNPGDVTEVHASKIAVEMLRYNVKHMSEYQEKEGVNFISSMDRKIKYEESPLFSYTDQQLFDELQNRGYKGSLSKEIIIYLK